MLLLVSGATATVRRHPEVGVLIEPRHRSDPAKLPLDRLWAMDNGAFGGFDADAFRRMLRRYAPYASPTLLFVTAPDVVAQAEATLELFTIWEPQLHAVGWPLALVAQDGLRPADVPWDSIEALFIGGSTDWKLGPEARQLVGLAQRRGKWTHMGRVNRNARMRYALRLGVDSIDGTSFSRWPDVHIPRAARVVRRFQGGPLLEGL